MGWAELWKCQFHEIVIHYIIIIVKETLRNTT